MNLANFTRQTDCRIEAAMPQHDPAEQDVIAKKAAERIVGTLIQTYLSPAVIDVLRNSIMANHQPKLTVTLNTSHPYPIAYKLTIISFSGPHAETFPLYVQIAVLTPQDNDALWRKIFAAINQNQVLNRRYVIADLNLDVDSGAVTFCM